MYSFNSYMYSFIIYFKKNTQEVVHVKNNIRVPICIYNTFSNIVIN